MLQVFGAIVFSTLAYTALLLGATRLPPAYAAGAALLAPLIGLAGAAFAFAPMRKRER